MRNALRKAAALGTIALVVILLGGCAGSPPPSPSKPEAPEPQADPITAEFGDAWSAAEVRLESGDPHDRGENRVVAGFRVVWTDGQKAGVVYPEKFVSVNSGEEVPMEFTWDSGGDIARGVYDVYVEVDARCDEGWLRNLPLRGDRQLEVTIDLNGCQFALPLGTYREVTVYPAGTHEDFAARNMLGSIPDDLAITWYNSENKGHWAVAPSGTFDLRVEYVDGTVDWMTGYELPANTRVTEL